MNRHVLIAILFALLSAAPAVHAAEKAEVERRLMENMAADEDGWSDAAPEETGAEGLDAAPAASAPDYLDEQNPHESLRRPAVPAGNKPAADAAPPKGE